MKSLEDASFKMGFRTSCSFSFLAESFRVSDETNIQSSSGHIFKSRIAFAKLEMKVFLIK